jgi:copper chaperone NosL
MLTLRRGAVLRPSLLTAAWLLAGCTRSPQPIAYGGDACDYCRMVISDQRYGAELVTAKGKVHKFDSVECLAAYYLERRGEGSVASVWVADFQRPGTLVPAEAARYLRVSGPASPMGKGLMAFAPSADTAGLRRTFGGDPLRWTDVLALVEREGIAPRADAGAEVGAHAR